jgi:uncharacterized membrane protein YvlD (DUF360 family)
VIVRLIVNAAALWVATRIVPGISFTGEWWLLFAVALVFGVLNVAVKPILLLLTLPFLLITLGLFLLVLNGVMLWLTERRFQRARPRLPCGRLHVSLHGRPCRQRRQFRALLVRLV